MTQAELTEQQELIEDTTANLDERLEALAHKLSDNFCYGCYIVVQGDSCPKCHSDDFMRHVVGVGVEYGYQWVIDNLVQGELEAIEEDDNDEAYDDMLDECYPDLEIGCCSWTASHILKEMDPICYRVGKSEYFDSIKEDMELWEDGDGNDYKVEDVENMIDNLS